MRTEVKNLVMRSLPWVAAFERYYYRVILRVTIRLAVARCDTHHIAVRAQALTCRAKFCWRSPMTIRSTSAIGLALSFAVLTWTGAARAKDNSPHVQQQQQHQPVGVQKAKAKSSPILHQQVSGGKHFKKAGIE